MFIWWHGDNFSAMELAAPFHSAINDSAESKGGPRLFPTEVLQFMPAKCEGVHHPTLEPSKFSRFNSESYTAIKSSTCRRTASTSLLDEQLNDTRSANAKTLTSHPSPSCALILFSTMMARHSGSSLWGVVSPHLFDNRTLAARVASVAKTAPLVPECLLPRDASG